GRVVYRPVEPDVPVGLDVDDAGVVAAELDADRQVGPDAAGPEVLGALLADLEELVGRRREDPPAARLRARVAVYDRRAGGRDVAVREGQVAAGDRAGLQERAFAQRLLAERARGDAVGRVAVGDLEAPERGRVPLLGDLGQQPLPLLPGVAPVVDRVVLG